MIESNKGFTVVESLIYIALFVVVSTASFAALIHYYTLFQQYQVQQTLFQTGTSIMERVLLEVRESTVVDLDQSEWEIEDGRLVLFVDGEDVAIELVDGMVEIRTSDDTTTLNDERVTIDTLMFYRYTTENVTLVRIRLQATSRLDTYQESWEWESAAVARGTYSE